MKGRTRKILSLFLCFGLLFQQIGFAQVAAQLDISSHITQLQNALTADKFRPLHLRFFSFNGSQDRFNLLLDKGDMKNASDDNLRSQTQENFKYFLIGISLPNDSFWVNLRPDSPDNILDNSLAQTDIGKILLEADLQLKKDTARFTSPEGAKGKEYWDKLYKKAGEIFGYDNVTIPTLTRPWIVPGEVIIRYSDNSAYIYKATLKVMLEQDYLKDSTVYNFQDERLKTLNEYSSQLIRDLIIPRLTREVNVSKRYAKLRQVFYSLILAQWFKQRFNNNGSGYARMIDRMNLSGLLSQENWSKTTYFKEYQKSFKNGEYNITEPISTPFGQTIRSYFSGGVELAKATGGTLFTAVSTAGSPLGQGVGFERALQANRGFVGYVVNSQREVVPLDIQATPSQISGYSDDRRGWNGEANDILTPEIRQALNKRTFAACNAVFTASKIYFSQANFVFHDSHDDYAIHKEDQKIQLSLEQLSLLESIINEASWTHLLGNDITIVFIHGQKAHYGVGRNQIYLDVDDLNNPELLKEKLRHEVTERNDVIEKLKQAGFYDELQKTALTPDVRSPQLKAAIKEAANESHLRLLDLELQDVSNLRAGATTAEQWRFIAQKMIVLSERLNYYPDISGSLSERQQEQWQQLISKRNNLAHTISRALLNQPNEVLPDSLTMDEEEMSRIVTMTDYFDMFRDYDYRYTGTNPLDPKFPFLLGITWADMVLQKAKTAGITDNRKVVVARDGRKIESGLTDALVKGLRFRGLDVIYVAADSPDAVTSYSWAVQELKPLMGIFITASHVSRPKTEIVRGFKVQMLTREGGRLLSLTTKEIKEVSKTAVKKLAEHPETIGESRVLESSYKVQDIDANCIRFNALVGKVVAQGDSLYDLAQELREANVPLNVLTAWEQRLGVSEPLKGIKVVIEGTHTKSGMLAASTFEKLGARVRLLNGDIQEIEGEHTADPSKDKNLSQLRTAMIEEAADFGMAFDLDGDRGAIIVPEKSSDKSKTNFVTLAPDNLITVLLPYLIEKCGYNPKTINKKIGVIRDVLGTFGINDMAAKLGAQVFQTDAGYVFLKAKREKLLDEGGWVVPIYGERSGHCWLDVSGEIENPLAVAVLFSTMVKQEKYRDNNPISRSPFIETYNEKSIAYVQSPRFQPLFHSALLVRLSADTRNTTGWRYDSSSRKNPPQVVIALGKDTGVAALSQEFTTGKEYSTSAGQLKVREFNTYQDPPDEGGLYRFADIVFELADGRFAGRFVFRASSNDPTFVCSYESPVIAGESSEVIEKRKAYVGGIVLDWLESNGYALVTKEGIGRELKLTPEEADKKSSDMNLKPVENDLMVFRLDVALQARASSPAENAIMTNVEQTLVRLGTENFEPRLQEMYGVLDKGEAEQRDHYMAKIGFDGKENRLGWTSANLEWVLQNSQKVERVLRDAESIRTKYKYVIFCGMGGSGLSVQVVKTTFGEQETKIYSLRTTDPRAIKDILDEIAAAEGSLKTGLAKTLVIPISKSGKTEETVKHKAYFSSLFTQFGMDDKTHMWVVTDKGSPMNTGSYEQREIQLNSKGDIGGRFTSPSTNIFLLPLAIVAPGKIKDILRIAQEMNTKKLKQDDFLRLGAYLYYMAAKQGKDKLTLFMPDELKDIPLWAEQLFEESLGKGGRGISLFYGEKLAPDELRPIGQNDRVFFRINIGNNKTNQELWDYLVSQGYPVIEIDVEGINSIGGIMLGLERTVAAIAYLWDICFVDQPAVEGYKKATGEVMQSLGQGEQVKVPTEWRQVSFKGLKLYYSPLIEAGILGETELAAEVGKLGGSMDDAAAVYVAILRLLHNKPGFEAAEVISYGKMTPVLAAILEDMRYSVFTHGLKMPAKLGEGPDKNHSFHQNIEDGKDMWFSTYFMMSQLSQPEAQSFDPNLLLAQTIGTVKSLIVKQRKVVLFAFDEKQEIAEPVIQEFFGRVAQLLATTAEINSNDGATVGSSPTSSKNLDGEEKRGGIDFTRINMIIQPQLHSLKTNFKLPERQLLQRMDIDTENNEIQNLMRAGILPSSQRLIEYITAYYLCNAGRGKIDNAVGCIVDYFKLEEENCYSTDEIVKNLLVLIESGKIN